MYNDRIDEERIIYQSNTIRSFVNSVLEKKSPTTKHCDNEKYKVKSTFVL